MAQIIKLKNSIMKSVEVEVCCFCIALAVVSRVLNGSEVRIIKCIGHNNHTARVLTRCSLYTGATDSQTVFFGFRYNLTSFGKILFNISVSCFIGNTGNGTCLENVTVTE